MFNGDRRIPTRGSTVPACLVSHWNGGPESRRIFLSTLNTNGWFFFSFLTQHHRIVLRMFPLCLNMEVSEVNERIKHQAQNKQRRVCCNMCGKNGSVGRDVFIIFFNPNNWDVIMLHQHKCCVYNGKRKLELPITCENFVLFVLKSVFILLCKYIFLENVEKEVYSRGF